MFLSSITSLLSKISQHRVNGVEERALRTLFVKITKDDSSVRENVRKDGVMINRHLLYYVACVFLCHF